MIAINTNNQIVKFDYPIKDLRENVEVKQKELSHELDSTPLKRENYCRENEIVLKEPLKLDKESIVSLQEEKSSLKTKIIEKHYHFIWESGTYKNTTIDTTSRDADEIFQWWVEWEKGIIERNELRREKYFIENKEKENKLVWKGGTYKIDITGKKATISTLDKYSGDFRPCKTIEVSEDEKNVFFKIEYHSNSKKDLYVDNISSNSIENKIEENTFSSSSSHFLDEYLKQKDFSNQFLIHQLIDNKLLKNLNLIV